MRSADQLLGLLIEYLAYMGSMGILAWRWERHTGRDAFGLVSAMAVSILVVQGLTEHFGVNVWISLSIGGACGAAIFCLVEFATDRFNFSLLEVLFIAMASIIVFDGLTEHSPVALGSLARSMPPYLVSIAVSVWLLEFFANSRMRRLTARVGRDGQWIRRYWRGGMQFASGLPVGVLLLFIPVVGIPLATTGLLSSTILKDSALAILLARVTGSRSSHFLVAMTASLGALRLLFGYFVLGGAGPPLVEGAAIIIALLWLRKRGFRGVMDRSYDRAAH